MRILPPGIGEIFASITHNNNNNTVISYGDGYIQGVGYYIVRDNRTGLFGASWYDGLKNSSLESKIGLHPTHERAIGKIMNHWEKHNSYGIRIT